MAEIQFFKPTRSQGRKDKLTSDVHVTIALKGKNRKQSNYDFYLSNLMKKYNVKWRYARVGKFNGAIYIEEGISSDGYLIYRMRDITNRLLVENLFDYFGVEKPTKEDESITINLNSIKFEKGFLLSLA